MLTPDVNVKTAASECSRKMGENTVNTVTQPTQVQKQLNDGYRRPWGEITEARYIDQLETLALTDWCRGFGGESFKSMEFTGGDVTAIFVRYGARFFECHDLHTRNHRELIGDVINRFCLDAPLNSAH